MQCRKGPSRCTVTQEKQQFCWLCEQLHAQINIVVVKKACSGCTLVEEKMTLHDVM